MSVQDVIGSMHKTGTTNRPVRHVIGKLGRLEPDLSSEVATRRI